MDGVGHQHPRVYKQPTLLCCVRQPLAIELAVLVREEDGLSIHTTLDDVKGLPFDEESFEPGHGGVSRASGVRVVKA
jgi:hypothetical protein